MGQNANSDLRKPLIFIVDDQSMLLDLAEASLSSQDYVMRKFLDPVQALNAFLESSPKPDLLITDYAMEHMNGLDLAQECKAIHPQLRTILISGSMGAEIIMDSPVSIDQFLPKPYHPAKLAELVATVLAF